MSSSNAGCTMFRGSVKGTGYPLHLPVYPLTSPPVRHRVPSHFDWSGRKGGYHVITVTDFVFCRSQWPRGLRVRLH